MLPNEISLCLFSDIGANLTDEMYKGVYHGKTKHEADLSDVLARSWDNGLTHMLITGGSCEDAQNAIQLAKTDGEESTPVRKITTTADSEKKIHSLHIHVYRPTLGDRGLSPDPLLRVLGEPRGVPVAPERPGRCQQRQSGSYWRVRP